MGAQLDDVGVSQKPFLHLDLLVDHLPNHRVSSVLSDNLQCPPTPPLLAHHEHMPNCPRPDLPAYHEPCSLDLDLLL